MQWQGSRGMFRRCWQAGRQAHPGIFMPMLTVMGRVGAVG